MRFLRDENVDNRLGSWLREQGHDSATVAHDFQAALPDVEVLALAHREQRVLITNDTDFGELIFRQGLPHGGVILFRLGSAALAPKRARLEYVIRNHAADIHQFLVIGDHGVRIRRSR